MVSHRLKRGAINVRGVVTDVGGQTRCVSLLPGLEGPAAVGNKRIRDLETARFDALCCGMVFSALQLVGLEDDRVTTRTQTVDCSKQSALIPCEDDAGWPPPPSPKSVPKPHARQARVAEGRDLDIQGGQGTEPHLTPELSRFIPSVCEERDLMAEGGQSVAGPEHLNGLGAG